MPESIYKEKVNRLKKLMKNLQEVIDSITEEM